MHTLTSSSRRRRAAGFTLLEVLIAIVVVAFGLLGLAGLQVFALKNNQSATLRVTATNLTTDIIDRMKANYIGVINNQYDRPNTADYGTKVVSCGGTGCTPAELAQNDLKEWRDRVRATLPGGDGIVCLDRTPNDPAPPATVPATPGCDGAGITGYAVKIWWYDDRTQVNKANPATLKYMYTAFNP